MIHYTQITDFDAPELDIYARLTEAQLLNRFEPKKGMFIAESPKVIMRALDAGCIPVSLLVERGHVNAEAEEAILRCGDVPVFTAPLDVLTQLTGFQLTRGMLCAMRRAAAFILPAHSMPLRPLRNMARSRADTLLCGASCAAIPSMKAVMTLYRRYFMF